MEIQRDINIIALDYLKITGAKDLKDLEVNYQEYYKYFQEETKRVSSSKKTVKLETISKANEIALEEVTELIKDNFIKEVKCKKCNATLFKYSPNLRFYTVDEEIEFMRTSEVIKVKCSCGEKYKFKKINDKDFDEMKIVQNKIEEIL